MEQNEVKVSIIVPLYNCENYIKRCITSLLKQTYNNIEIIVVDDGSKDKSGEIARDFEKKNSIIKYIYQKNGGPGLARNKAIMQSRGKYILFVDSDDYLEENYVQDLVESAEKYSSELVIAGYTLVYESGKRSESIIPKRYVKGISEEWAYRISACCSRLYLKDFWDSHNLKFSQEKEARAEDVPIALYSNAMAKNISVVPNAGYYYYQHSRSAMNSKKNVIFGFPYESFEEMYKKVMLKKTENDKDFFSMGILKFLAQFDLVIYRKASRRVKKEFRRYLAVLLGKEFYFLVDGWRRIRKKIELPLVHKIAIDIFILKYKNAWKYKKVN